MPASKSSRTKVYVYEFDGKYKDITDLIISMSYTCSIDKPCQQLDIKLVYGIYSDALPTFFIDNQQKIEVYYDNACIFRGKVEQTNFDTDEVESIIAFDYIYLLTKNQITKDMNEKSAYQAVCEILDELELPYSTGGIFGGPDGEGSKLKLSHFVNKQTAYNVIMMIATEMHRNYGTFYYVYMDVSGNINIMDCDKYWAKKTIMACSDSSMQNPDGNLINMEYEKNSSNVITRVACFDNKGQPINIATGESAEEDEE